MADLRLRARSATEIVDAAFQIYRRDALEYILVTAVTYAPLLIAQLMLFGATNAAVDPRTLMGGFGALWLVLFILGLFGFALMTAVVSRFSSDVYLGRSPDLAAILREMLPKVPRLIGASFLLAIVMMLGAIPFIASMAMGSIGVGVLGFILAVVWSFYAYARFFASFPVIVLEDRGIIDAFTRSGFLSRGRKGHILVTIFLVFLIFVVLLIAVMAVAALVGNPMTGAVLQMIYTIIAYPLIGIAQMVLYYDMRIRAEGFDIEVMTGALNAASAPREATS
jgi:hypothetical protein